jgi:amidohydrolase
VNAILERARAFQPAVTEIRRTLHKHPEPGFREFLTADLIEREFASIGGFRVRRVAGTGIIADIGPEVSGLMLRADIDALEIQEENSHEYRSQVPGMMHACGHDAHTAILLGAARVIAAAASGLTRRVRLVFQPCEETHPGGAGAMIREGVLDGVEAAVALHVYPQEKVGTIALRPGEMMANSDDFDIGFRGLSGHAAQPHRANDTLLAAAEFVSRVQSIVSRRVDPFESMVVTIGRLEAGTRRNIIAGGARLEGTMRTLCPELREKGRAWIERTARSVAESHEIEFDFHFIEGYPVVLNDPAMTAWIERVAVDTIGGGSVRRMRNPSMGGEDFAYYARKVPSCFFRLGSGGDDPGTRNMHHNACFDIDEGCLPVGVAMMASAALGWKGLPPAPPGVVEADRCDADAGAGA